LIVINALGRWLAWSWREQYSRPFALRQRLNDRSNVALDCLHADPLDNQLSSPLWTSIDI